MLLWPGDGIGPEIVTSAQRVVDATGVGIDWVSMPAGVGEGGVGLTEKHLQLFEDCGVMLKGPLTIASGSGSVTVRGRSFTSGNQVFRKVYTLYANLRPVTAYEGVKTPFPKLDWVIFRENTEDIYTGEERWVDADTVEGIKRNTRLGCRRIAQRALTYAREQGRKRVTFIHKANVCKKGDGLFLEECWKVAKEMGMESICEAQLADSFLALAVQDCSAYDVLVCPNLFGDLISDLAGGMAGSLGLCGSGNLGDKYALFEPAHGSAPGIAGKGIASPISTVLSSSLMMRFLNENGAADRIDAAVRAVVAQGIVTPDLGGTANTETVTSAIIKHL